MASPFAGSSSASAHASPSTPKHKQSKKTPAGSSSKSRNKFTDTMKDRQARGKPTGYSKNETGDGLRSDADKGDDEEEEETDDDSGPSMARRKRTIRISSAEDAYESGERRRFAACVLDSPELLRMHAESRGDSLPGTRLHFTKILCGYENEAITGNILVKISKGQGSRSTSGSSSGKGKGTSLGRAVFGPTY